MSEDRRFCYIDFDEVFSIFWARGFNGYIQLQNTGHYYHPAVIDAFLQMVTDRSLIPVWVTSWEEGVHRLSERMGFTDSCSYEVLSAMEHDANLDNWLKFDSVSSHFSAHRPSTALWLDDDIYSYGFAVEWCVEQGVKWFSPNKMTGLTLNDIGSLDRWLLEQ